MNNYFAEDPYDYWLKVQRDKDFRSRETQTTTFTRQTLKDPEYLYTSNRVNPGPLRNTRATVAELAEQTPHDFGNEDLWGWSEWQREDLIASDCSDSLLE